MYMRASFLALTGYFRINFNSGLSIITSNDNLISSPWAEESNKGAETNDHIT